jgi:hypothetical protein
MFLRRPFFVLSSCAFAIMPLFADISCPSANLATLIGTTCDIGPFQFTFDGLNSQNFRNVGGHVSIGGWSASDFLLTPTSDGFRLSFDGGPQNIAAPGGGDVADDYAELVFDVSVPGGELVGVDVSGGILLATGTFGDGFYQNDVCSTSGCGASEMQAFTSTSAGHIVRTGPPFMSGHSAASDIFNLHADNGATASWDGTPTTFIFEASTPEPHTFPVSIITLFALFSVRWTRKRHCEFL